MAGRLQLREIFNRYATVSQDGERFMTTDIFIHKYLDLFKENPANPKSHKNNKYVTDLFTSIASRTQPGLISFDEFEAFEKLLSEPDALYRLIFELYNTKRTGLISYEEFHEITKHTENYQVFPEFMEKSNIIKLYFGRARNHLLSYSEFCQFLHDFNEEFLYAIFRKYDGNGSGFIKIEDFYTIMTTYDSHLISETVLKYLITLASNNSFKLLDPDELAKQTKWKKAKGLDHYCNIRRRNTFGKISYSFYSTFHQLLRRMTIIKLIYLSQSGGSKSAYLSKQDFLEYLNLRKEYNCQLNITPTEFEILFELVDLIKLEQENEKRVHSHRQTVEKLETEGKLRYNDLLLISPDFKPMTKCEKVQRNKPKINPNRAMEVRIYENLYRFSLGAVAGAIGAFAVYPIDLVKTRMQSQRTLISAPVRSSSAAARKLQPLYNSSMDCFKKILQKEGIPGLYRGLPLQVLGVAPEKAIKLAVNDLMRDLFTNPKDCEISLLGEVLAGTVAGISQVVVTNPLEIVKIRLQTAGEIAQHKQQSFTTAPVPETQKSDLVKDVTANTKKGLQVFDPRTVNVDINLRRPEALPKPPSAFQIIKELGIRGLYKGAHACMLRDVTFTATYFTVYSRIKGQLEDETGYNPPWTLLVSALLAGLPASSLATPADVIKTRLQVANRAGETVYSGIVDAAEKIYKEEGPKAFFKGIVPRLLRSSPQFGITIFGYELLQRYLYIDFGGNQKPRGAISTQELHVQLHEQQRKGFFSKDTVKLLEKTVTVQNPEITVVQEDRIGGYKYAAQLFQDVQTKFGFKFLKN